MKKITTFIQLEVLADILSKDYPDCADQLKDINNSIAESKSFDKEEALVRMAIVDIKDVVGFVAYNAAIQKV